MGVEFHWQVEAEDGWQAPPSPRRGQVPWRAWGALALVLIAAVGVAAGVIWQRARQGEERLRRELRVVVNLEAQVLRNGDRGAFLALQDQEDSLWYKQQKDRFTPWSRGVKLEPGQEANLAVVEAALLPAENGPRARAEVAWALEDGIYRRSQFYRQETGQWLRTGVRREYFGPESIHETAHFVFQYWTYDEPAVQWMAEQLETWHEAVCVDLGCDAGPRINVLVTPVGGSGREFRLPEGFIVTSLQLRAMREDGAPLLEERKELAQMLIHLLTARQASDIQVWQQPYLLPQFVNWQMRRLGLADEDTPPTPVLDAVMASHGLEGVRALLAAMGQTESETEALRLALGLDLEALNMVFGQYLAALLAVERQMIEWQVAELVNPTSAPLARQTFGALLAQQAGSWRSEKDLAFQEWRDRRDVYPFRMPLSHPVVDRWALLDDSTLWAEVTYSEARGLFAGSATLRRVEFFQRVDGVWRHAPPDERYLGEEVALNSEHFRILCHEREVELMASGLARLELIYRQFAAALHVGLPSNERLTIRIIPLTTSASSPYDTDANEVTIPWPHFYAWSGDGGAGYLASSVSYKLLQRLALRSVGPSNLQALTGSRWSIWWPAILNTWQWKVVAPESTDWFRWLRETGPLASAVRSGELILLSEMGQVTFDPYAHPPRSTTSWRWEASLERITLQEISYDPESVLRDGEVLEWELVNQEVWSVMYYIAETYGPPAVSGAVAGVAGGRLAGKLAANGAGR